MPNRLIVDPGEYARLERHLLRGHDEQVAFCFARTEATEGGVVFEVGDSYLVPPEDLAVQTPRHVALTDEAQGRLIKEAWDKGAALIEVHSHTDPRFPAEFSFSDRAGFETFVPHVWWRLKGRPYLALVVTSLSFDAIVWRTGPQNAEALDVLEIGRQLRQPTNLTLTSRREAPRGQR